MQLNYHRKPKVVVILNDLGFFITHRLPVFLSLQKEGYDVSVGYGNLGKGDVHLLKSMNITTRCLNFNRGGINPFKEFLALLNIARFLFNHKSCILHLITLKASIYGGFLSLLFNIPCTIYSIAGLGSLLPNYLTSSSLSSLLIQNILKLSFNSSNKSFIFQNSNDRQIFENLGYCRRNESILIHGSGVNLNEIVYSNPPINEKFTILYLGRLLVEKGVHDLILACKQMTNMNEDYRVLFAGDIDLENPSSIDTQYINHHRNAYITFLGHVHDVIGLIKKCDVVCYPSYYGEGLPKSLIESSAVGRPIITTDHPGCRDAIIHNKTGLLVDIKSPNQIADCLCFLKNNNQIRSQMGINARQFAENKFSIDECIIRHKDLYNLHFEFVFLNVNQIH